MLELKNIHIGAFIQKRFQERNIPMMRVCAFMNCVEEDVWAMFRSQVISIDKLLRWSKLLEYDFFRLYSQHLILYAPTKSAGYKTKGDKSTLPRFKKSVYTKEIIDYLLELIYSKEKTAAEVIKEYKIPKTTLYRWMQKYPAKK